MRRERQKYNLTLLFVLIILACLLPRYFFLSRLALSGNVDTSTNIHTSALVVGAHCDTMMRVIDDNGSPCYNLGKHTCFELDLPKLLQGGVDVQFFAVWATKRYYPNHTLDRSLALINALYYTVDKNPETIGLAKSTNDLENLARERKIAAVTAIEGADTIKPKFGLDLLHQYYDLGIRVIGLTWNDSNQMAAGCGERYHNDLPSAKGVTDFGREIIKEMNRLGILIDVSHLAESRFWDIMELSEDLVIASHSGVYALKKHSRNLTDEQILAIAETSGVVQIVFHTLFLEDPGIPVTVKNIADHIDYVVNLAGIDHVGLGSDFDGQGYMPEDLKNASMLPNITRELISRGYTESEVKKILGGNTLRLINEVWRNTAGGETRKGDLFTPLVPSQMGQQVKNSVPLAVRVNNIGDIDKCSFRVILDGKVYPCRYQETTGLLWTSPIELKEGFHVITFAVKSLLSEEYRQSIIFKQKNTLLKS